MIVTAKKLLPTTLKRSLKKGYKTLWQSVMAYSRTARLPVKRGDSYHLLFICKGNVCRSAFAEFYLKSKGLQENMTIESCGLEVEEQCGSPEMALTVAAEFGVDLESNCAKSVHSLDVDRADIIVLMEYDHYLQFISLFPEKKENSFLLRQFLPLPGGMNCNIYDPFGEGERSFRKCFLLMQRALDGLVRQIEMKEGKSLRRLTSETN